MVLQSLLHEFTKLASSSLSTPTSVSLLLPPPSPMFARRLYPQLAICWKRCDFYSRINDTKTERGIKILLYSLFLTWHGTFHSLRDTNFVRIDSTVHHFSVQRSMSNIAVPDSHQTSCLSRDNYFNRHLKNGILFVPNSLIIWYIYMNSVIKKWKKCDSRLPKAKRAKTGSNQQRDQKHLGARERQKRRAQKYKLLSTLRVLL